MGAKVKLACLVVAPGCKHLVLGMPSPYSWGCKALGARVKPAHLAIKTRHLGCANPRT